MNYYHVITRSYGEKSIFNDEEDCLFYLKAVKDACEQYQLAWLAYAVMPTHTHLIWGGELEHIIKARRKISCRYSIYARQKYAYLFLEKKKVIRPNNSIKWLQTAYDIKNTICYIHLNPIRKNLEGSLGESIRGSYLAPFSVWEPNNRKNPFCYFFALEELRETLALQSVCKLFGHNGNAQKQSYLSWHQKTLAEQVPETPAGNLKKADAIVHEFFERTRFYKGKPYDAKNREAFLLSLNRRNHPYKSQLVCRISQETGLSTGAIADFLHMGRTTVKNILKKSTK